MVHLDDLCFKRENEGRTEEPDRRRARPCTVRFFSSRPVVAVVENIRCRKRIRQGFLTKPELDFTRERSRWAKRRGAEFDAWSSSMRTASMRRVETPRAEVDDVTKRHVTKRAKRNGFATCESHLRMLCQFRHTSIMRKQLSRHCGLKKKEQSLASPLTKLQLTQSFSPHALRISPFALQVTPAA